MPTARGASKPRSAPLPRLVLVLHSWLFPAVCLPLGFFTFPERFKLLAQGRSNQNPLDLIEGDGIPGAVIELGGARRFVGGDRLGVLDGAAVLQIRGDAGGPERMVADAGRQVDPRPRRLIM